MRSAVLRCTVPFAVAALAACASGRGGGRRDSAARPRVYVDSEVVQVRVRSNYIGPLDVFLVSEGVASRLGEVMGSQQTFVVDPAMYDIHDLRIVAVPVGGYGRASTGPLNVRRGNVVDFTVQQQLRQSSVLIR